MAWIALAAAAPNGAEAIRHRLDAGLSGRSAGPDRAAWAGSLLLGAPYRPSPLGEGSGIDPDPRFRLDAFDCVTFVETAIALGHARTVGEAERLLDDVRYSGAPQYRNRNHYVESQWLPSLVAKGWLEPSTRQVAGPATRVASKRLDESAWEAAARSGHAVAGLSSADLPRGDFAIEIVPLTDALAIGPRIPNGTVLLVVRENRPNRPSRITHMGLVVVRADGARVVRHASDVPGALRVRDEPLDAFLRRAGRQKWKVAGVSLYRVRENSGRAADVLGSGAEPGAIKDR